MPVTTEDYKGITVITGDPSGSGGLLINDALKTIADKLDVLGSTFNVKEYGAKGDGVTNDLVACRAAAAAAAAATPPGRVYFPRGEYLFVVAADEPVFRSGHWRTGISYVGEGVGVTILNVANGGTLFSIEIPTPSVFVSIEKISIEDMTLQGPGNIGAGFGIEVTEYNASTKTTGLMSDFHSSIFRRLNIDGFKGGGILLTRESFSNRFEEITFVNISGHQLEGKFGICSMAKGCYFNYPVENKAGVRMYSGSLVAIACNGVDGPGMWADIGSSTSAPFSEAFNAQAFLTLINCNLEGFGAWATLGNCVGVRGRAFDGLSKSVVTLVGANSFVTGSKATDNVTNQHGRAIENCLVRCFGGTPLANLGSSTYTEQSDGNEYAFVDCRLEVWAADSAFWRKSWDSVAEERVPARLFCEPNTFQLDINSPLTDFPEGISFTQIVTGVGPESNTGVLITYRSYQIIGGNQAGRDWQEFHGNDSGQRFWRVWQSNSEWSLWLQYLSFNAFNSTVTLPSGTKFGGDVEFTGNILTKQVRSEPVLLTDGTNISWNLDTAPVAFVALGGNRTLSNPTNIRAGATYALQVTQDGTGSRTLAYGNAYKWAGGTPPVLSTAPGAKDVLTFISFDGSTLVGTIIKAVA